MVDLLRGAPLALNKSRDDQTQTLRLTKTAHDRAFKTLPCTRATNKIKDLTSPLLAALKFCTRASLLAALTCAALPASANTLKVFAAASLTNALDDALTTCADTPAIGIYAGSGTLARQIEQGAPADLYISANPQWMDWLEKRERIAADMRADLLGNRLAFVMGDGHTELLRGDVENPWEHFTTARIALADTKTVPAGIYAKQALENLGWWEKPEVQAALVSASSVREALTWVVRGEAGFGIVYASDAKSTPQLNTVLIDEGHHDPIRYPAAVIADNNSPNARRLLTCLQGEEASTVFEKYGFTVLSE